MISENEIREAVEMFERRQAWIIERLSSPDVESDSQEWEELERDYENELRMNLFMEQDEAQYQYEEQRWLEQNPHTTVYDSAISILSEIRDEGRLLVSESFIKMQISYCVTILESCLGEMIKSVALSHKRYVSFAINNINDLKSMSVPLNDLLQPKNTASTYVQKYLSDILYHKIQLVVAVYKCILQPKKYKPIPMKDVLSLVRLRHDIVHRNGKNTEGTPHHFTSAILDETFRTVEDFLTAMRDMINDAVEHHEAEQIGKDMSD